MIKPIKGLTTRTNKIPSGLDVYIKHLEDYEPLSSEEELLLGKIVAEGDPRQRKRAIDQLVLHNLRLVMSIAKKYSRRSGVDIDDLIQDGTIGLYSAAEKFDYTQGNRFSTYATFWIEREIRCCLTEYQMPVHIPTGQRATLWKLKKDLLEVDPNNPLAPYVMPAQSLDDVDTFDLVQYSADLQEAPKSLSGRLYTQYLLRLVKKHLVDLTAGEQFVIKNHWDALNSHPQTQQRLSDQLQVTRQRVCALERTGLKRLNKKLAEEVGEAVSPADFLE